LLPWEVKQALDPIEDVAVGKDKQNFHFFLEEGGVPSPINSKPPILWTF
jgi:hypothetical protein